MSVACHPCLYTQATYPRWEKVHLHILQRVLRSKNHQHHDLARRRPPKSWNHRPKKVIQRDTHYQWRVYSVSSCNKFGEHRCLYVVFSSTDLHLTASLLMVTWQFDCVSLKINYFSRNLWKRTVTLCFFYCILPYAQLIISVGNTRLLVRIVILYNGWL